ncbi:MAG: DUF6495 family protein [Saprospiraceae bacterium]|nr:hypothetical protein [Lewinella sp.]
MKYRRLRQDELEQLEQEFIHFLVANGVPGPDWEKIKTTDADKAEDLIALFSDIIFDKTLEQIQYLEFKSPKDIKTFHCQADKIILNGLKIDGETTLDLTITQDPQEMMRQLASSPAKLRLYTAQKEYHPNRKQELFNMMESGALISRDGALFKTLEGLK